jgi:hypothetical protein
VRPVEDAARRVAVIGKAMAGVSSVCSSAIVRGVPSVVVVYGECRTRAVQRSGTVMAACTVPIDHRREMTDRGAVRSNEASQTIDTTYDGGSAECAVQNALDSAESVIIWPPQSHNELFTLFRECTTVSRQQTG